MKHASFVLLVCPKTIRILLQRRAFDANKSPGKWFGFGGKGEKGESPFQTAERELIEETQFKNNEFKIKNKYIFKHRIENNNESPKDIYIFLGIMSEESIPIVDYETSGWSWLELSDLINLPLHPILSLLLLDKNASSQLANAFK